MQQVLDNLKELPTGTKDIDLIFLRGIMESPVVRSLAKVSYALSQGWFCTAVGRTQTLLKQFHYWFFYCHTNVFSTNITNTLVTRVGIIKR